MASPPIQQAATLVLLRDAGAHLETLLLQRSSKVDFAASAWVFPGGRVDNTDTEGAGGHAERAARLAAVRETAEEAALQVAPDALVPFAHWTTPEGAPRRYATWFFMASCTDGRPVQVDGSEITQSRWTSPQAALAAHRAGDLPMMPPTFITLQQLAAMRTVAEALDVFSTRPVEVFCPKPILAGEEVCFLYEGDAGYADGRVDVPEPHHRFWMGSESRYVRS